MNYGSRKIYCFILCSLCFFSIPLKAQKITFADHAELYLPGIVSTKNADVKITFSPDGKKMLWGGIDYIPGKKDSDIWESEYINDKWTKPERVSFDSDSNDFDPFFSPDGKGVYFFSNRPGGFGGDDIYFAAYDVKMNKYLPAVNLGNTINTSKNEWTPVTDPTGKYLYFSSDGHGGYGKQDLFYSKISNFSYGVPINLGHSVNGSEDDFDLTLLEGGHIIFTSCRQKNEKADLYLSYFKEGHFSSPVKLPPQINLTFTK
eukprot:gene14679-17356_t